MLRCIQAELHQTRCRPLAGRLPVLLGVATAVTAFGLGGAGIAVEGIAGLREVLGEVAKVIVCLSFITSAAITYDALASGATATDRCSFGRPALSLLAQAVGGAVWCAGMAFTVAVLFSAGLIGGAALSGGMAADWAVRDVVIAVARLGGASAVAGAAGVALARASRSFLVPTVGLFGMLLAGDPLLASTAPWTAPLLVADNLIALGTHRNEGLAVDSVDPAGDGLIVVGALVVFVALTAWAECLRDAPSSSARH